MKALDTLFAVLALALALSGSIALSAYDDHVYGAQELQALSVGFDALAHQAFDCRNCFDGTLGAAGSLVAMAADKPSVNQ